MPVLVLALSALLAAPPATSEAPTDQVRYQRQSTSAPRARADALQRRLEQAKRTWAREAEELAREPGHQFRICRACISFEMRLKQIAYLINLVETTSEDDPEYPDYLFRLADHYVEAKDHYKLQAASAGAKLDELEFEVEMEAFESEAAPTAED
jgi:hypothetical protein